MTRTKKTFSPEGAALRASLHLSRPRWRRVLPATLLVNPQHPVSDKLTALTLDEGACGSICRYERATVARKSRLSAETVREATKRLVKAGYLERVQVGPQKWEYRLRKRQPATWMPGWTLDWWRSELAADLPPELLVLWGAAIQNTPSPALLDQSPSLGPWCELPIAELARGLKITHNRITWLIEETARAGLILAVMRPRRPPIIYPVTAPVTWAERAAQADYLGDLVVDRDGTAAEVCGLNAPTVWDDERLAHLIARRLGDPPMSKPGPAAERELEGVA